MENVNVEKGYFIANSDEFGEVYVIERIDEMNMFDSDIDAAKQAKNDNIKIMFLPDNKRWEPLCFYGVVAEKINLIKAYNFILNSRSLDNPEEMAVEFKGLVKKEFNIEV